MNEAASKKERGSALEKALAVLEAVTDQPQAVGLPDLTVRLGLPRQTVHRVLMNLVDTGLLVRDPSRDRFSVGPRLSGLALNVLHSRNQAAPIRLVLQDLVDEIRETCNIGVLDAGEFVYLERIECDWSLRVFFQAGSRVPAYCTSGGKALLAYLPAELRDRILKGVTLKKHTETTIADPAALEAELDRVRETGYSTNNQEFTLGILGVGVPILDASGRPMAALACHAPAVRISLDRLEEHVPKLKAAADRLAKAWDANTPSAGLAA